MMRDVSIIGCGMKKFGQHNVNLGLIPDFGGMNGPPASASYGRYKCISGEKPVV